ncbi:MAG TPA: hypothetical protein VFE53_05340 [Mucilaginibacter sp.]|nr:hypothetical protein [Mucilaginibacter sp.]
MKGETLTRYTPMPILLPPTATGTPEPPGTGEYTWDTWYTNFFFNSLVFIKNFLYSFYLQFL